ncbi:MAG: NAD(P)/FAD-dependent oxidoreductase, partial [Candidatus Omnitrophica bacterium]|nr:NAD(P)/FAD-dependent oxidoreductase [Candidatus Omnitrophota bacterium]
MEYDVIIIGAGVAGLTSALKLSHAGRRVLLLEKQPLPGGYATVFKRKGFTFESAIHCVDALGEGGEIRKFLEEAGLDKKLDFIPLKNFARVIYPGHNFLVTPRHEDFIAYLSQSFPEEAGNIKKLFLDIDKFYAQFDKFCNVKFPLWLKLVLVPFLYPAIIMASRLTTKQFIARFITGDRLQALITDIWRFAGLPPEDLGAFYFLLIFRGYYYNPTAYIRGGFIRLFEAMVEEIKNSGSEVRFNTTVKKIVTDRGSIKSVVTEKGEEFKARAIISNANAIDTFTSLIDDEALKEIYRKKLLGLEKSISAVQVYLGLDVPARSLGMNEYMFSINTTYEHDESMRFSLAGDYERCSIEIVDHSQLDPGLVPPGKGGLVIMSLDSYTNWQGLS